MIKSTDPAAAVTSPPVGEDETVSKPVEKRVQVEILNGCGKEGIAKIFQNYLQDQGFDVVNTDNYIENGKRRWNLPASLIIDQSGQMAAAREIAKVLGIDKEKITAKPDAQAVYDISIVIGRDYNLLTPITGKNR